MKKLRLLRTGTTILVMLFFISESLFAQDCDFKVSATVTPVSCPGNGQITVNLSETEGKNLSDFRYSLISPQVNIDKSTSNVFAGLSPGTYKVIVDAICGTGTTEQTLENVVVGSNYTIPSLGLVQGSFTSSHPYGVISSFACSPTGKMQLRIEDGVFPYSVEITKDGVPFRTDHFASAMYTGNDPNRYDYKEYYTIDNLPPGNYVFHVTDGCGYSMPFVSGTVPSISETYSVERAYIYRDPGNIANSNIVKLSLLQGISGDNTYYYYGLTQSQGTETWWEYAVSVDGGSSFTPWADVSNNGVVQQTLPISNYCSLYGKTIQVKVRDKVCQKEYTKNFNVTYPNINQNYQFTTDSATSTPATYDACGYTNKKDILKQHTSSYYQEVNSFKANQLSNSAADFYYTPPLTVKVTNSSTGTVLNETTQTTASYNWRQNVTVTPDMNGNTINITVTDKNGCVISNRNQVISYQEKTATNGGNRVNTTWNITSSAQGDDNCGEHDRQINIVRQNPSADYLDSTVIHLTQSPNNNKYNFTATYRSATNTWTITKENPTNTATITPGNPVANNLSIVAPDLPSGTYIFTIVTQCKTETIQKNFTFPNFLSITEQPRYEITPNCGFLDVTPTAGQVQANGSNTATYFAVVSGEPGGYPNYAVTAGQKLQLTIRGTYTLRMYSNVSGYSSCGIKDTTIVFGSANIDFDYLIAYVCNPDDTIAHVNARGKSGKRPYTYSLYKDANQTQLLASDTIGDFADVHARYRDILYLKIEDACGASFVASVDVVNLEATRKAWFENNNEKELSICQGDTAYLNGLSLGDVVYSWSGPNGFTDTLQNTQLRIPRTITDPGYYYLEVRNSFCPIVKDSLYLEIIQAPSVTILDNAAICPGEDYTVNLTAHGNGSINYTVAREMNSVITEQTFSGRTDGQTDNMVVSPLSTMRVWLKDVSDNQCAYNTPEDTISITIKSIATSCNITAPEVQVCYNSTAEMAVTTDLSVPYVVNWYTDAALTNQIKSETISAASQQSTMSIPNLTHDTVFYVSTSNADYCEYIPGVTASEVVMNTGQTTINCGEAIRFYDSGGTAGNYGNNEDLVHTFISSSGDPVNIRFDAFHTESADFDKMYIYDGGDINAPLLAQELGGDLSGNLPGPYVSTGDRLTVLFVSNFNNNFEGWSATVGVKDASTQVIAKSLDTLSVNVTSSQQLPIHYNSSTVLTANASGGHGTFAYQWYTSPDSANWTLSSITTATYNVSNLTTPTYYRVVVTDNSATPCPGQAETGLFLNVANITLSLDLQTNEHAVCPGNMSMTLYVRNDGPQIATNVISEVNLPEVIALNGAHKLTIQFAQVLPHSYDSLLINNLTVAASLRATAPIIKGQIMKADQGDSNPSIIYGDWDWKGNPRQVDEDTLMIKLKRVTTNNEIIALNDSICYGDNAVLAASTAFSYPQHFYWYNDKQGTMPLFDEIIQNGSSQFTIPGLIKDTVAYVSVSNDSICPYTIINKNHNQYLVMQDGLGKISIDEIINFTDSQSQNGHYSQNENYTYTLVSPSGDPIEIEFSSFFTDATSNDYLYLYDGHSTADSLLAALSGNLNNRVPFKYTTTGNALTISFQSNESESYVGWSAQISTLQQLKSVAAFVKEFADQTTITTVPDTICPDATAQLQASSTIAYPQTFKWYSDSLLTNLVYEEDIDGKTKTESVYSLPNQTVDTVYYVTVGNDNTCNLSPAGLTVTSYKPARATIVITQPVISVAADSVCIGSTISLLPATGGTWASNNINIATVTTTGVVTGVSAGKTTFTFTDNVTGCFTETDSVKVNPLPTVNVQNIAICMGSDADLTTAVTLQPGSSALYYSDATGNTQVANPGAVPDIINNSIYYVKAQDNITGCQSALKQFNLTVHSLPTVSVQDITICSGTDADLTTSVTNVVADTLQFYSDVAGTIPVTNPKAVTGIVTDTTFYVKAVNTTTQCESTLHPVNVALTAAPVIQSQSSNSPICEGDILNIVYELENATSATVAGLPTGITYSLSGNSLSITGTTTAGTFDYTITTAGQTQECQAAVLDADFTVNSTPVAAFSYVVNTTDPLTVQFTGQSTIGSDGTITERKWNFGDGDSIQGNNQTPLHTYASADFYDVTLTVTSNAGCTSSTTQTLHTSANIRAIFDIEDDTQCMAGNRFVFTNNSVIQGANTIKYLWDFGDGQTSDRANATHTYDAPGTYVVILTITTDEGEPTESIQSTSAIVQVLPYPPAMAQDLSLCMGGNISLT